MYFTMLKIQKFIEAGYQSFLSFLRVLFRFRFISGISKDAPAAKSIFILANGPSLRHDLDRYGKEISSLNTMAVNMFMLSDDFTLIKPKYYIIVDTVILREDTLDRIRNQGYEVLGHFRLPDDSWSIEYHKPLKAAKEQYARKNPDYKAAKTVIDYIQNEIDDYEKYSEYYGYTFYICEARPE